MKIYNSRKFTIEEMLSIPKGMDILEYQRLLTKQDNIIKKIRKLNDERDFLLEGLDVLSDEAGSNRWRDKCTKLNKVDFQIKKYTEQLQGIESQLNL